MANTRRKGSTLGQKEVGNESLPLAVRIITIDGKRMTPAFYKQLTSEDLIDESTGDLRGIALGYFHLHTKECPNVPHKHVLWGTETRLHLATIVSLSDDDRYQKQARSSHQKQEQVISLLALVLALAGQKHTIEWISENRRKVSIASYTLFISSDIAEHLEDLEEARAQYKEDEAVVQGQQEKHGNMAEGKERAAAVLEYFTAQGIGIIHPVLLKHDSHFYGSWKTYPSDARSGNQKEVLLYWRGKDRSGQKAQEEYNRSYVEEQLASSHVVYDLRLMLSEQLLLSRMQLVREMAEEFAQEETIIPKHVVGKTAEVQQGSKPESIEDADPDQLWRAYEQESKRFKAYTQRWEKHLEAIMAVEQLFLVP